MNLAKKTVVTLTANFERNLESIESFLVEAKSVEAVTAVTPLE